MKRNHEISKTMNEIDDYDLPEITEDYLRNTEIITDTSETETAFLSISRDVMKYFRGTGKGYMMRLSNIVDSFLKDYISEQKLKEVV